MSPLTTPDQISASILATLANTAPQLSCAIGTPERQIIDACAAQISAAYIGQYLTGGMMDIMTKSGLELDQFVGIFGFGRLQGTPATGTVTMTLSNVSTQSTPVPLNSQFYTTPGLGGLSTTVYYASTQAVVLPAGSYQVSIPVRCTTVGTAGNVPPDSITSQSAAIGSSVVTNTSAMTGGTNVETDSQLRQRFMDTLLRNISGTEDWYINTALQNNNVARATVYGPVSLYATQISVPQSQTTLTLSQNIKYVWPDGNSCFTGIGTDAETFYSPVDDYNLSNGFGSPTFTTIPSGALSAMTDDVVDLEFQYTTACSRNNPNANPPITNKIDVFIDGSTPFVVTETCVFNPAVKFTNNSADPYYYYGNFERIENTDPVSSSSYFTRLGSVPIMNFPSSIVSGGTVYSEGVNYYVVKDTTSRRGSQQEWSGLEWFNNPPSGNQQLVVNYTYNQIPQILDAVYGSSKQICTDVLTHVADYQYITTCLTIEYARNYSIPLVNNAIVSRLQIFYQTLGFGAPVIVSQMEASIQQVLGVNEVHLTTSAEAGDGSFNYGIWVMDTSATTPNANILPKTTDFVLNDNQLAVYQNALTKQAPNIGGGGA